jgi:microsomal epoxide hydrolase
VLVDNSVGEEPAPSGKYSMTAALRKDRAGTLHRFVRAMFRTPQPEDYYARIEQAALKMPLEAGIQLLSWTWPRSAWRDALYATGKPVLYVVSAQYAAQAANVSRRRPDIRVEVFPDAGHALFVDQAERFNALLEGFVQPLAVGAR